MSENRKYYYMKLKENFFTDAKMVILESMQDGLLYSNLLLKMYLMSLKYNGVLMLNDHKLDRPIFPMGARILHVRHQSLLQNGTSQSVLRGQKVAVRQNGAAIPSGEITRYTIKILKSIKLSAEYYSRKEPGKILRPNELLGSTYRYMVHYTCGLGAMESGTANYLCGKSLTGNSIDDYYTSFSSAEGLERLYAYMHRLCVSEPLPQGIPPQVSEDGGRETCTFSPKNVA